MSGSADNPHVLDDSEQDVVPRRASARRVYIDVLSASDTSSESPPPQPTRTLPVRESARSTSSSLKPPPLAKRTSLRSSSGSRTPQDRHSLNDSPAINEIKASPRSPRDTRVASSSSQTRDGYLAAPHPDGNRMSSNSNDEMEGVEKSPTRPGVRTRQDSLDGPDSQESFDQSIGSSSPLLTRICEQRTRTRPSTSNPQAQTTPQKKGKGRAVEQQDDKPLDHETLARIDSFLVDFEKKTLDDHATAVSWILYDTRQAVREAKPICVDEKSPFESLSSVAVRPGDLLPEGVPLVTMESMISKKNRMGKSKSLLVSKSIKSETPRVPRYTHNTMVRRNILTMDDEKLRYVPYMGDAEASKKKNARLLQELAAAYNPKGTSSGRETEWSYQIRAYLAEYLDDLGMGLTLDKLVQYSLGQFDDASGRSLEDIHALIDQYEEPLEPRDRQLAKAFSESFNKILKNSLRDTLLPEDCLREMAQQIKTPNEEKLTKTPPKPQTGKNYIDNDDPDPNTDRLGTYTTLTCLICGAMSCQTHGDSVRDESAPGYYQYIHQPLVTTYHDILRKQDGRAAAAKPDPPDFGVETESPCGPECYLITDKDRCDEDVSADDLIKIESMVISLREKKRRPCTISFFVELPCWLVHREIQQIPPRPVELPEIGRSKHPDWYNNQKKTLKWDWQDTTTAHLHQKRCQANPCAHDGPCQKGCPCYDAHLLCESICGCSDDCPRKFTGCACHSAGLACVSDSCICLQMNRECGPQCTSCGAIPRLNLDNRHDEEIFTTGCQNIHLQRGISRKLIMGESQLEGVGFGLYLGEPVRKGEFLCEYVGEVISFLEADRRGITYDRKYVSFLFDLNSEWTIDAVRLGNKSRFINHADNDKDGLNCEAKIVLVNGEHRIKFMALRDIKVGEELLFNYGKNFAEKQGLTKKLPRTKDASNRGSAAGDDGADDLDGTSRGKMTAIRGGRGRGSGRPRKSRKRASKEQLDEAPDEAAAEEAAAADDIYNFPLEDDEDEDIRDGRRKRKIVRPARYTR